MCIERQTHLISRTETECRLESLFKSQQQELLAPADPRDLLQLQSDLMKMKRRCKHILDVTDRYCVLTDNDLRISGNGSGSPSNNKENERHNLSSEDSVDGSVSSSDEVRT